MTQAKSHPWSDVYQKIGFYLIGIFSLLYTIFWNGFAELHIQLPFLNFPIFIGEILLFVCILLTLARFSQRPVPLPKLYYWIFFAYLLWLLIKAFRGYMAYGPLAFRTAALFYYPFFFIFGYFFCNQKFFTQNMLYFLSLTLLFLQTERLGMWGYFRPTLLVLSIICALNFPNKKIRYPYLALLTILVTSKNLFAGSKTHIIGVAASILFLLWYFITHSLVAIKKRYRLLIFVAALVILTGGIYLLGNKEKVRVLFNFNLNNALENYRQSESTIDQRKKNFQVRTIPSQIYNKNPRTILQEFRRFELGKRVPVDDRLFGIDLDIINERFALIKKYLLRDFSDLISQKDIRPELVPSLVKQYEKIIDAELSNIKREIKQSAQEKRLDALGQGDFTIEAFAELEKIIKFQIEKGVTQATNEGNRLLAESSELPAAKIDEPTTDKDNKPYTKSESVQSPSSDVDEGPKKVKMDTFNQVMNDPDLSNTGNIIYRTDAEVIGGREYNNILFRVFIWRDMMEDLIEQKAWWWGISFGKPQRSKRIEMLQMARAEWMRDGWIAPHNSYFHVIYRAGIIGILLIGVLAFVMIRMIQRFTALKSLVGILLASALIYWLTIANFLVILELPYNAIPFWSLFGMTYAYLHQLENKKMSESSSPQPPVIPISMSTNQGYPGKEKILK